MYSENNNLNQQLKIWLFVLLSMIILIILIGGLTRLTDSGLSITTWELFAGLLPPLTNDKWKDYFELYKTIPEYSEQNSNMTLSEFKIIFTPDKSVTTPKITCKNILKPIINIGFLKFLLVSLKTKINK